MTFVRGVFIVMTALVVVVVEIGVLFVLVLVIDVVKARCFVTFFVISLLSVALTLVSPFGLVVMSIMTGIFAVRFLVTSFVTVVTWNTKCI